jgi:hypothetical protein
MTTFNERTFALDMTITLQRRGSALICIRCV